MHKRDHLKPSGLRDLANNLWSDNAPTLPTDAIIKREDGTLEYQGASLSRVGLSIPADYGKNRWEELGRILSQIDTSLMWWVGDWMAYGEKLKYGETETLAELLGIRIKNLYDYVYVSSRVTFSVRTENLSWSHHKLVAKFEDPDEQRYWLSMAEQQGWNRNQLKQAMNDHYQQHREPDRAGEYKKDLDYPDQIINKAALYTPEQRHTLAQRLRLAADALESL